MHQIVDVSWPQGSYHPGAEEAVFVAATSGDGGTLFVQSTFEEDVANARADGKALGFYHFNGAQAAAASAEAFWAAIKPYWRPGDALGLDIESYNGGATPAQSWAWALAFATRLAQLIVVSLAALRLGIYGNRSTMSAPGWGALERAGCWLWLAAPGGYPENTPVGEWSHWTILQYDSAGNLDRDESELTFAQIAGAVATVALSTTPLPRIEDDEMIKIYSPGRQSALIGPGYVFHLTDDELALQAEGIATKVIEGNDRQYDLWLKMATQGQAIAASAAPPVDYAKLASAIVDAGGTAPTAAQIAKAVNDDAAARLAK